MDAPFGPDQAQRIAPGAVYPRSGARRHGSATLIEKPHHSSEITFLSHSADKPNPAQTDSIAEESKVVVGGFGSYHPGGANFAFGDGHVSFISETTPPELLQQLGHRADGKLPAGQF